jgi:hypothetical protein
MLNDAKTFLSTYRAVPKCQYIGRWVDGSCPEQEMFITIIAAISVIVAPSITAEDAISLTVATEKRTILADEVAYIRGSLSWVPRIIPMTV